MTKFATTDVFVAYQRGYPVDLATDDIYTDKAEAEQFAKDSNEQRAKHFPGVANALYQVTTLDDYMYMRRNDAREEGRDQERQSHYE